MTTTPNDRDREIASECLLIGKDICISNELAASMMQEAIASYRAEIEARKECEIDNLNRAYASAIEQRDANRVRIATVTDALEKAEKALNEQDSLEAFKLKVEALAAIRKAKSTSPPRRGNQRGGELD